MSIDYDEINEQQMIGWENAYSPDFQDAYERRFEPRVKGKPVFQEWVNEFRIWINMNSKKTYEPTKPQIKALGYNAKKEGIENFAIRTKIKDKRTSTGYRYVWKDIKTGKFAKNPFTLENEELP